MPREITITISDESYQGLHKLAAGRSIGEAIEELAGFAVDQSGLEAAYREMSLNADREHEAAEWSEALIGDSWPGASGVPR